MKIKLTKSGISFGSLVKLVSVGCFIGMGILFVLWVPFFYSDWGDTMPLFVWLMFPILIAVESLIVAVIVAAGLKLYGIIGKFETSSCERPLQPVNQGDGE
jgi:hypothetical protein